MFRHYRLICFCGLVFGIAGCGAGFSPVTGVVTIDGAPLASATVTLVSEDAKSSYSGVTDDAGNFTIASGAQPGAPSGTYKVLVTKVKGLAGAEGMSAGDPEYMKGMEKMFKEQKGSGGPKMPPGMKGPPGMLMPGGGSSGSTPVPKSEIPILYGSVSSTPLSLKVPVENPPAKFDLNSGPKKK